MFHWLFALPTSCSGPTLRIGWGAAVTDQFVLGLWLEGESQLSVNHRELLAVQRGLYNLRDLLQGQVVAVFPNNTTSVSYLCHQGGTFSSALNRIAQEILHWAESQEISLLPQFVLGRSNVVADALSRPHQVIGAEWTLHQEVFDMFRRKWPVTVDLFTSTLNHRCGVYFAPVLDPMAAGTDAMLQSWDFLMAYAFPPFVLIPQMLVKLRASQGAVDSNSTILASEGMVPRSARSGRASSGASTQVGPIATASHGEVSSKSPSAKASCLETLRQFVRASSFSSGVAKRLGYARRSSSIANYQCK